MLDGVDRAGEFFDAEGEGGGEIIEHDGRRAHLAVFDLVGLERRGTDREPQKRCDPARRRRLHMAVELTGAEQVEERSRCSFERGLDRHKRLFTTHLGVCGSLLNRAAGLAHRTSLRIDGQRRLVPEEVAGHRREDEAQTRVDRRHREHSERAREPRLVLVGHDDRRCLVRPKDRNLLGDVVGGRAGQAGGTHKNQWLRRQVDVFLVLGAVGGDRLVTELAQLDPDLLRCDPVRPVADHRPVAPARRELAGGLADDVATAEHGLHCGRQFSDALQQVGAVVGHLVTEQLVSDGDRQQEPRCDLRVERLR